MKTHLDLWPFKKRNMFSSKGQLRRAAHSDASVFEFQELMVWITRLESDSWVFRMSLESDPDHMSSLRYWVSFTIVTATYPCISQASFSFSNDFIDDSLGKVLFNHQKFVCFCCCFFSLEATPTVRQYATYCVSTWISFELPVQPPGTNEGG